MRVCKILRKRLTFEIAKLVKILETTTISPDNFFHGVRQTLDLRPTCKAFVLQAGCFLIHKLLIL